MHFKVIHLLTLKEHFFRSNFPISKARKKHCQFIICIATNQIDKMKFLGRFLLKNYFSEVFVKSMKKIWNFIRRTLVKNHFHKTYWLHPQNKQDKLKEVTKAFRLQWIFALWKQWIVQSYRTVVSCNYACSLRTPPSNEGRPLDCSSCAVVDPVLWVLCFCCKFNLSSSDVLTGHEGNYIVMSGIFQDHSPI